MPVWSVVAPAYSLGLRLVCAARLVSDCARMRFRPTHTGFCTCTAPCSQLPGKYKVWNPIPQPTTPSDPAVAEQLRKWQDRACGDLQCIHDCFQSEGEDFAWHGQCCLGMCSTPAG